MSADHSTRAPERAEAGAAAGAEAGAGGDPPAREPLRRNRDFTLLWSGQAVSDLGSQMSVICYPLLVLASTGSAGKAGFVGGSQLIATLLTLLPAGVMADRYPRRRILIVSSLMQMAAVGSVVPAVVSHHVLLAHLMAVGVMQGACNAFYLGASRGALPRIVSSAQLPGATALTQARGQAATLAGPPLGGALFAAAKALPFALDSVSFGAIAAAAGLMRASLDPVRDPRKPREPVVKAVGRGMRFVLAEPFLRTYGLWGASVNAVAAGMLLMVIVVAEHHGATPSEVGTLLSASALCGLGGSLFGPRLARRVGSRVWVLITSWSLPACAVGIAFAPWVWLIAVLGAITTFTIMPANVVFLVRATRITPDELQAQAGNARQLLTQSLSWLAPPTFGFLIDTLGARAAILIAAALYAVTAIWLQFNRELLKLDADPRESGA